MLRSDIHKLNNTKQGTGQERRAIEESRKDTEHILNRFSSGKTAVERRFARIDRTKVGVNRLFIGVSMLFIGVGGAEVCPHRLDKGTNVLLSHLRS